MVTRLPGSAPAGGSIRNVFETARLTTPSAIAAPNDKTATTVTFQLSRKVRKDRIGAAVIVPPFCHLRGSETRSARNSPATCQPRKTRTPLPDPASSNRQDRPIQSGAGQRVPAFRLLSYRLLRLRFVFQRSGSAKDGVIEVVNPAYVPRATPRQRYTESRRDLFRAALRAVLMD